MALKYKVKTPYLYRKIGERVYLARRRLGKTQEQVADEIGMDRTYLSQIEHGKRNPSATNLSKLSKALNINFPELGIGRKRKSKNKNKKREQ